MRPLTAHQKAAIDTAKMTPLIRRGRSYYGTHITTCSTRFARLSIERCTFHRALRFAHYGAQTWAVDPTQEYEIIGPYGRKVCRCLNTNIQQPEPI